jgi:hypothetical protein
MNIIKDIIIKADGNVSILLEDVSTGALSKIILMGGDDRAGILIESVRKCMEKLKGTEMRKVLLVTAMVAFTNCAYAQNAIKTRLDHLSGTQWVLVVSYLHSEITSITCDTWTMLGINS